MFIRNVEPKDAMKTGVFNDLTTSDLHRTSMLAEKYTEEELMLIYEKIRARNILLDNRDINSLHRHEQIYFNNQIVKAIKLSRKNQTKNATSHFVEGCAVKFDFCGQEQKVYIEFVGKRTKKVKLGLQGRMFGYNYFKKGEVIERQTWKLSRNTTTLLSKEEQEAFDKEQKALEKEKNINDTKIAIERYTRCLENEKKCNNKDGIELYEKCIRELNEKLNQLLNPKKEEKMKAKETKKQTKMVVKTKAHKAPLKNDRFDKIVSKYFTIQKNLLIDDAKLKSLDIVRDNPKVYSEFFMDKNKNIFRLSKFAISTGNTVKLQFMGNNVNKLANHVSKKDWADAVRKTVEMIKDLKKKVINSEEYKNDTAKYEKACANRVKR